METNYLYKDELYISLESDREPADGPLSRAEPRQEKFGPDRPGSDRSSISWLVERQTGLVVIFFFHGCFYLERLLTFDLLRTCRVSTPTLAPPPRWEET